MKLALISSPDCDLSHAHVRLGFDVRLSSGRDASHRDSGLMRIGSPAMQTSPPIETLRKPLYLAAALLMAATSAHAGNGMSFVIDGKKIRIDAPKNCSS